MVTSRMTTWLRIQRCYAEVIDLIGSTSEPEPEEAQPPPTDKAEKRKVAHPPAAPPAPNMAPKQQKTRMCSVAVDGQVVRQGQREGITKSGTRCADERAFLPPTINQTVFFNTTYLPLSLYLLTIRHACAACIRRHGGEVLKKTRVNFPNDPAAVLGI